MSVSLVTRPQVHDYAVTATDSPNSAERGPQTKSNKAAPSDRDAGSPPASRALETSLSLDGAGTGEVRSRSVFDAFAASVRPASARVWNSVKRTAVWMEEGLAEFFGLNESKYQWAIVEREYQARQKAENERVAAEREAARQEAMASREMA